MYMNTSQVFDTPKIKEHDIHFNEALNFRVLCTRGAAQNVCNGIYTMKAHIQCNPCQFIKKWFLFLCNEICRFYNIYQRPCINDFHSTNI